MKPILYVEFFIRLYNIQIGHIYNLLYLIRHM